MVVVVDPAIVDIPALQAQVGNVIGTMTPPPAGFQIVVSAGCNSAKSLLAPESIIQSRSWDSTAVLPSFGWDLHAQDSTFHVSFDAGEEADAQQLQNALGSLVSIQFEHGSRLACSRGSDCPAHYGGAGIRGGGGTFCSSGFTVHLSNGHLGSVTNGHCYNSGNKLYSWDEKYYYGLAQGKVNYPTDDMEAIDPDGQSFSPKIWVDPCCPSVRTVTSTGGTSIGNLICVSGAASGALCGLSVSETNHRYCDADGCTPGAIAAARSGDVVSNAGDSGGPMYTRPNGTDAKIHGMIFAGDGCDANGNYCTTVYGEPISTIESVLGVSVEFG